ncbi:hypothetical protein [Sphingomonas ginsenosidivorax]|nr:hypothetical protein [Sphingomonas ginsenosidivorax]
MSAVISRALEISASTVQRQPSSNDILGHLKMNEWLMFGDRNWPANVG